MDPTHPICVLKVDMSCCSKCWVNLKKILLKIDGVKAVDIDQEKGTVTVSGEPDPQMILQTIQKKKKCAEILSYQDPRKKSQEPKPAKSEPKPKKKSSDYDKKKELAEHESEPYVAPKTACRDPFCKHQGVGGIKSKAPTTITQYPPLYGNFPPPEAFMNTYYGAPYSAYPGGYYNYQNWQGNRPQIRPFGFDRQIAHPQFSPYVPQLTQRPVVQSHYCSRGDTCGPNCRMH